MTAQNRFSTGEAYLAIDIAKNVSEALLELPSGKQKAISFPHHRKGLSQLTSLLRRNQGKVTIAFEPTGDYHRVLAHHFLREGFHVVQVSSIAVARYREIVFGTWDKNDRKDTRVIMHLVKLGMTQRYYEPLQSAAHGMRELSNIYRHISLFKTRVQHQLRTHFLPLYFPELEKYWCSSRSLWLVRMLQLFPTPAHIMAVPKDEFIAACRSVAKRAASHKPGKFEAIYALAFESVGVPADEVALESFRHHLSHLEDLIHRRAELEKRAVKALKALPDAEILQSLPGIGPVHALTILAEAGDLRRFQHHRQFLNYCGFNLSKVQSGTFRGQERLSKRGNAALRKTFWMAACVAIQKSENCFRMKYKRYTSHDPNNRDLRRKARTAVAVKMARVAHALVVKNERYRQYYEHDLPSGMTSISKVRGGTASVTS